MWKTNSILFKIIQVTSSAKNNFTINLKDYYNNIKVALDKINIYCIPKLLRTHGGATGYEINIEKPKYENDYTYKIITQYKGVVETPITLAKECYTKRGTIINFDKSLNIEKNCKYVIVKYGSELFINDNYLDVYFDGSLKKTFTSPHRRDYWYDEIKIDIDNNEIPHVIRLVNRSYDDVRFDDDYFYYEVNAQYYNIIQDIDNEINCFFIVEDNINVEKYQ